MKKLILLAMVLGLLATNVCHAQSGKDAIRALQKLQARVEVGITYRDYAPAIGDAKFEVTLFLRSPESKENQKLASRIERCLIDHQLAMSVWNLYLTDLQQGFTRQGIIPIKGIQNLSNTFPEITDVIRNSPVRDKKFILLSEVLSMIWKDAGKALEGANNLLVDKLSVTPEEQTKTKGYEGSSYSKEEIEKATKGYTREEPEFEKVR